MDRAITTALLSDALIYMSYPARKADLSKTPVSPRFKAMQRS